MTTDITPEAPGMAGKVLLVDDEAQFRTAMKKQLEARGYSVMDVSSGDDAIKIVRHKSPEVIVLDQKMPGMDGIQTLKEIKKIRPEVQVIMLTGHGSTDAARLTGKFDVFKYMAKPCALNELIGNIEAARQERIYSMARHEIPDLKKNTLRAWLAGEHNARPGLIILGILLFTAIVLMPTPQRMRMLLTAEKTGQAGELINGYSDYRKMKTGETITDYYSHKAGIENVEKNADGKPVKTPAKPNQVFLRAKVMIGTLVVAALFWASGAIPVGMTALLVGVLMYVFGVLQPNGVAQAYAKDSVIFIFGVLAVSAAVSKTGLDKRIGILLLGSSRSLARLAFIFCPLLAMTASFLSEHALVAFIVPVIMIGYAGVVKAAGLAKDRNLAVMLILMVCFVANIGGPGSPAAGGRNAVMIGILADYGLAPSFANWVKHGLPFVPVCALSIAAYFFFTFKRKLKVRDVDIISIIKVESERIGKMTRQEYITAAVLVLLIVLWSTASSKIGMGGPVIIAIVLLNISGIIRWKDVNAIHWDVVALYASASAMGAGLAYTGAALWLADSFVTILPESLRSGTGLFVSSSLFTGILTNFMSDGATVAAIGPITVPMATLSGTNPVMVGYATAFASSFAHMMIIGTPNNAIAFSLAKDPETGEQLVTMKDFLVHGSAVIMISFAVLWLWCFMGYWKWIG